LAGVIVRSYARRVTDIPLLWLIGTAGSGKTTTAWALFSQLADEGVRVAYVDCDQLGMAYPARPEDPDNDQVTAQGLGAVWPGFRAAGAQCLIVSGVVERAGTVADYAAQVPDTAMTLVELRVGTEELRDRLIGRDSGYLIEPAIALAAALEREPLTEHRVDTGGRSVEDVAKLVRGCIGDWPGVTASSVRAFDAPAPVPAESDRMPMAWICGATGVGKSTVAFGVFMRLLNSGVKASYIDLAQIGWFRPAAEDDPDGHRLKARNLAALWRTHRAAGSEYLVVSGTGGGAATARHYLEAVPDCEPAIVRLDARPEILADRIRLRGKGIGVELPGDDLRGLPQADLERRIEAAKEEAAQLERDRIGEFRLDTSDRTPDELADAIMDRIRP
jgi:broad-specificity NMP kinase